MADEMDCSIRGCGVAFIPGKGGAGGMCWTHYQRARRGSKNAKVAELLHRGERTEKLTVRVTPEVAEWLTEKARSQDLPLSEWLASKLERDRARSVNR